MLVSRKKNRQSAIITVWLLLTSLLKRPHNLLLTGMQLAQYSLVQPILANQLGPFHYALAHYSLGMAWYFQQVIPSPVEKCVVMRCATRDILFLQGNGNNLARIDLQSGFVGLPGYNPLAVGKQKAHPTLFNTPVLTFLLFRIPVKLRHIFRPCPVTSFGP